MKINLIKVCAIPTVVALIFLGGCSKSGEEVSTNGKASTLTIEKLSSAVHTATSSIDPNTPLDRYIPVTERGGASDYVLVYYAFCNCEVDYDEIAQAFSQKYANTSDIFKKKEIIEKLKPDVDSKLAGIKEARLISFNQNMYFDAYDFGKKSFAGKNTLPLTVIDAQTPLQIKFEENPQLYHVPDGQSLIVRYHTIASINVPDEAQARQVESIRSSNNENLTTKLYGYVKSAGVENVKRNNGYNDYEEKIRVIDLQLVKYSLLGSKGKVVAGPFVAD